MLKPQGVCSEVSVLGLVQVTTQPCCKTEHNHCRKKPGCQAHGGIQAQVRGQPAL